MLVQLLQSGYLSGNVWFPHTHPALHCMLTSCGYECRTDASYDWHGLRRGKAEFSLFQYTLSGEGALCFEGRELRVCAGQAMLLHFPHDNRYWLPAHSEAWEFLYLCLNGSEIRRILLAAQRVSGPLLSLACSHSLIDAAAAIVLKVGNREIVSPFEASALAYRFAMDVARSVFPATAVGIGGEGVELARVYCRRHCGEAIGVADMAAAAGYSRHHFSRLFKEAEGVSPLQYLLGIRVEKAFVLLRTTTLTLKEIAQRCGFYDTAHLNRSFARFMQVTPGVVRRSGMFGNTPGGDP